MVNIPKESYVSISQQRIKPTYLLESDNNNIVFSFRAIEKNKYFNLDSTCPNWSQELFETMKTVSNIAVKDVYAGKYSGRNSTLRIHQHHNVKCPCELPSSVDIKDMWQIRIAKSKGGVHGVFFENIFYVIWFDPHHNLYPDERYGGLKLIKPPTTCCKDRDEQIQQLSQELEIQKKNAAFWEKYAEELQLKYESDS